jgi:MtN3 and saliva related transmembrane protein
MLLLLGIGLTLWLVYGFMQSDFVIVAANGASLAMLSVIGALKLRSITRP